MPADLEGPAVCIPTSLHPRLRCMETRTLHRIRLAFLVVDKRLTPRPLALAPHYTNRPNSRPLASARLTPSACASRKFWYRTFFSHFTLSAWETRCCECHYYRLRYAGSWPDAFKRIDWSYTDSSLPSTVLRGFSTPRRHTRRTRLSTTLKRPHRHRRQCLIGRL